MADRFTVANRRARVLQLRSMGLSTSAIADAEARETGNPRRTTSAILSDLKYALAAAKDEHDGQRELAGVLETERLDSLHRTVMTLLRAEAQQGQCAACGRTADPKMVLAAAGQLIRLAERRAALLGLDQKGKDVQPQAEDELAKIRARVHNEHPRQGGRRRGVK
jgi:hypothetical protein